jgi:hypothetical protein
MSVYFNETTWRYIPESGHLKHTDLYLSLYAELVPVLSITTNTHKYTSCSQHVLYPFASAVSFKLAASEEQHFETLTSQYQSHK